MLQINMLLLTLILGTIRPFGLYAVPHTLLSTAAAGETGLESFVGGIIANSDKIGIGVGFLVLAYLLVRQANSSDTRDKNNTAVDGKQLEIQTKQLELVGQGLQVGNSVANAVDKIDAAIGSIATIGTKMSEVLTKMDERETAWTDALKKSYGETYVSITNIQSLIEQLPERLVHYGGLLNSPSSDNAFASTTFSLKRGVMLADGNGVIISANAAALDLFHIKQHAILGKPFYEVGQITTDPINLKVLTKEERPTSFVLNTKLPMRDFLFGFFNEDTEVFDWFLMDIYPNVKDDKILAVMYKFISIGELIYFDKQGTAAIKGI